jgi:hypothetical protein
MSMMSIARQPTWRELVALLSVTGCLALPPGQAAAQPSSPFNLTCGNGEVLVGIQGRQGWWMDRISPRCRAVSNDGTLASAVTTRGGAGGTGGTALGPYDCRAGEVMVGLSGSQGSNGHVLYVHQVICAPWAAATRTAGTPTRTRSAFPQKSPPLVNGTWLAQSCFQGQVATALVGRAGDYVDRLTGLGCRHVAGATVPQPAPRPQPVAASGPITAAPGLIEPSGTYNVSLCPDPDNPRFRWNAVPNAAAYTVEFRNLSKNRQTTRRVSTTWSYAPGRFLEGDQYQWRVRGSNASGDGPWSQPMQFAGVEGAQKTPCVIGSTTRPYF